MDSTDDETSKPLNTPRRELRRGRTESSRRAPETQFSERRYSEQVRRPPRRSASGAGLNCKPEAQETRSTLRERSVTDPNSQAKRAAMRPLTSEQTVEQPQSSSVDVQRRKQRRSSSIARPGVAELKVDGPQYRRKTVRPPEHPQADQRERSRDQASHNVSHERFAGQASSNEIRHQRDPSIKRYTVSRSNQLVRYTRPLAYKRLDPRKHEIRLLRIDLTDLSQYELKSHISLDVSRPRYMALSYPWGHNRGKRAILVNGCTLAISQNLYLALEAVKQYWHSATTSRQDLYLWIDQICIDQEYATEKNHQVALMGNIYLMAEQVIVWLPVPRSIRMGFPNWQQWRQWHLKHSSKHYWKRDFSLLDPFNDTKPVRREGDRDSLLAWRNLHAIVGSTWWIRAWVYQELMLATRATFLIDGMSVPWDELYELLDKCYQRLPAHIDECYQTLSGLSQKAAGLRFMGYGAEASWMNAVRNVMLPLGILKTQGHKARVRLKDVHNQIEILDEYDSELSLVELPWNHATFTLRSRANRIKLQGTEDNPCQPLSILMTHGRNCKSSDRRDKVFAFLGLAGPRYQIIADYSPSLTEHALLTEVAARIIVVEQRLDILAIAMDDKDISPGGDHLPTWVPNWVRPENPNSEYKQFLSRIGFPLPTNENPRPCRASLDRRPRVQFFSDCYGTPGKVLRAHGIHVATLGRMSRDHHRRPYRRFKGRDSELRISTTHLARPGDEVWVLLGADEPFCFGKNGRDGSRVCSVLGHAMLEEDGLPSDILQGSMMLALERGEVELGTIDIS